MNLQRTAFLKRSALVVAVLLLAFASCAFGAESKGKTENVTPGMWAVRDGNRVDIANNSDVFEFDIIITDQSGSGTIRFVDDSTLEIRANSEVDIKEVVFSEDRNRFNVGVVEGSVKLITGSIVRKNPRGYRMSTPNSTVGIRGSEVDATTSSEGDNIDVTTEGLVEITDKKTKVSVQIHQASASYSSADGDINVNGQAVASQGVSVGGISLGLVETQTGAISMTTPTGKTESTDSNQNRNDGGSATGTTGGSTSGGSNDDNKNGGTSGGGNNGSGSGGGGGGNTGDCGGTTNAPR